MPNTNQNTDKPVDQPPQPIVPTAPSTPSIATNTSTASQTETLTGSPSPTEQIEPIIVSEADVKKVETDTLSAQIENLAGEVQALESKIDRLASGVVVNNEPPPTSEAKGSATQPEKPVTELKDEADNAENPEKEKTETSLTQTSPPVAITPKIEQESALAPKPIESNSEKIVAATEKDKAIEPASTANQAVAVSKPSEAKKSDSALEDIYARLDNQQKPGDKPSNQTVKHEDLGDLTESNDKGTVALIAEGLAILGFVFLMAMIATPWINNLIGGTLSGVLASYGWLGTLSVMALGFIIALFAKGQTSLKLLLGIVVILVALMYLGVHHKDLVAPLEGFLGGLFEMYRAPDESGARLF